MYKTLAVLTVLALGLQPAIAQDAAPAVPEAAAPTTSDAAPAAQTIVVDPAATFPNASKQTNLLTGFYATLAVIEICALPIPDDIKSGMAGDRTRLEASVGLDAVKAGEAYAKVLAEVQSTDPDCAEGSADRASVDAVTAIYAQASAAAAPAQ
ncbi:hypothetical protein PSC71_06320 [Devosia sp. J2-20]|jgi:biotin carboxyl carrier protein|uniref:Uncharacterized protein n=1 Tax=Devosia litorisediminis TaxID=2829817 RepID=A0A942EE80_9HYPH|nr:MULTISPECIES: hypothetical protein [Devosia]MBS3849619.1 hypothetical protein [Devosia litorisediminis]WDR00381.1 hypothetical protein PSC71_06320 [Devosia sp. J2-20]